jgi:hypothetical protein
MKRPLSVVGRDQDALTALLALHAPPDPRILDVTHNRGRMWKGLPYRPHRSDRDPELHEQGFTDTVADFRELPFPQGSFDVVVFDPPHQSDGGDNALGGDWGERYGTAGYECDPSDTFDAFLTEAARVLVPRSGMVLAKIADQVHTVYRWQHIDLVVAARAAGFTPCDLILRVALSRGQLIDPRWKRIGHVRQVHTYWLALRNGSQCYAATAPLVSRSLTGTMFEEVA